LGEQYKSFSYSLCNLLLSPVTSSLLGPNILLNTVFSNTLNFLSSCHVNDQVSHPYKKHVVSKGEKVNLPSEWYEDIEGEAEDKVEVRGLTLGFRLLYP